MLASRLFFTPFHRLFIRLVAGERMAAPYKHFLGDSYIFCILAADPKDNNSVSRLDEALRGLQLDGINFILCDLACQAVTKMVG